MDDLLSEVLLVVWRRLDEVPTSNSLPWCYGVARRVLANHRRGETRRLRLVEKIEAEPPPPLPSLGDDDSSPDLAAAMAELDDDDRELIRLWAWEQLEPREIAVVLESTPNAISLRLSRVKQKIAASIERQRSGGPGHIPGVRPEQSIGEM